MQRIWTCKLYKIKTNIVIIADCLNIAGVNLEGFEQSLKLMEESLIKNINGFEKSNNQSSNLLEMNKMALLIAGIKKLITPISNDIKTEELLRQISMMNSLNSDLSTMVNVLMEQKLQANYK